MDGDMDEVYCVEACSAEKFDPDYEFEAPRYYDFSRPETHWETEEAERWFDSAATYPPSPSIAKTNWGKVLHVGAPKLYMEEGHQNHMNSVNTDRDCSVGPDETRATVRRNGVEETRTVPIKSAVKLSSTRISTLMKPTASHLAKQRQCHEVHFDRVLRSQKFPVKDQETASQHSSIVENDATKRQKLEAGYLQKAANLKHRAVLQHKLSKMAGENVDSPHTRLKVTVPRAPHLETADRAQRRRSKQTAESANCIASNLAIVRAQNVNLKACLPKKGAKQLPESQIVGTLTPCPASKSGETDSKRSTSHGATKREKCEVKPKLRARPPDKLTLESDVRTNSNPRSKCLKENAPISAQQVQQAVKSTKGRPSTLAGDLRDLEGIL